MAQQPDYFDYWNAMAPLRARRPVAKNLATTLTNCGIPKIAPDGPGRTMPWYVVQGAPADLATNVLPREFFRWSQAYVVEALRLKPPNWFSTKARVLWALDVWTRIVQGGLALNVLEPLELPSLKRLYGELQAPHIAGVKTPARLGVGVITPAPFCDVPFNWAHEYPALAEHLYGMAPWTGTQVLGRKDNADLRELAGADEPTRAALFQWRIWSMQELEKLPEIDRRQWTPTGMHPGFFKSVTGIKNTRDAYDQYWPYHMGTRRNTGLLTAYIEAAHKESRTPTLVESRPDWHQPNFEWAYRIGLNNMIYDFRMLDYETVLQGRVLAWLEKSTPRFDAKGAPRKHKDGTLDSQPVTCTDFALAYEGKSKQIKAAAEAAMAAPAIGVSAAPGVVQKAAKQVAAIMAKISAVMTALNVTGGAAAVAGTFGAAATAMLSAAAAAGPFVLASTIAGTAIAWLLVEIGGLAVGHVSIPIFRIPQLFVRSLPVRGYNTQADGSTADVLLRVIDAVRNIEVATGFDLGFKPQPPTLRMTPSLRFQLAKDAAATRSEDKIKKAARTRSFVPVTFKLEAPVVPVSCEQLFMAWAAQDPTSSRCLDAADRGAIIDLCRQRVAGEITSDVEMLQRAQEVVATACRHKQPSVLGALLLGFRRSANPFVKE